MTTHITAVYEGGMLRLSAPLPLEEGAQVEVIVIESRRDGDAVRTGEILAAIAALPTTGGDIDPRDMYPLLHRALRDEGWDDPRMDEYNRYG